MKTNKKSEEYFEYKSEQEPEIHRTGDYFKDAKLNSYEHKIKPNLPLILKWLQLGRSYRQIAFSLDIDYTTFIKSIKLIEDLNNLVEYGKETYGMALERVLNEKAFGEKHFKSIEKLIEKNNSEYATNQADLIAQLGINKLQVQIEDMSLETDKLDYIQDYENRVKEIDNKE